MAKYDAPKGFKAEYARCGKKLASPQVLSDILGLVGYDATPEEVKGWSKEKRIQLEVYAVNVHLRASDNPIRKHPKPEWLPEPWNGPQRDVSRIREDLQGAFDGPSGTRLIEG